MCKLPLPRRGYRELGKPEHRPTASRAKWSLETATAARRHWLARTGVGPAPVSDKLLEPRRPVVWITKTENGW